ncbi:hypothetical protein ACXR8F_03635 [Terrabacter sp. AAH1]|jgi:hypothetical protein|nr:hypothetical protein UB45_11290 [Terrabacter sp. 28]
MSSPPEGPDRELPDWALAQAMHGREEADDLGRDERARLLVQAVENERHDDEDDEDQGGEG